GRRAGLGQRSSYRGHAAAITSASSRSGSPPEASRCRSRLRAARAATARSAAFAVSFFVAVPSSSWAAARVSSSTSIKVFATLLTSEPGYPPWVYQDIRHRTSAHGVPNLADGTVVTSQGSAWRDDRDEVSAISSTTERASWFPKRDDRAAQR